MCLLNFIFGQNWKHIEAMQNAFLNTVTMIIIITIIIIIIMITSETGKQYYNY